jgi:small subunit ribosomal protein S21
MIIVNVKENESIDRALKRFKKKFERTGVLKELRGRTHFVKPSVKKRTVQLKAAYRQKMYAEENY